MFRDRIAIAAWLILAASSEVRAQDVLPPPPAPTASGARSAAPRTAAPQAAAEGELVPIPEGELLPGEPGTFWEGEPVWEDESMAGHPVMYPGWAGTRVGHFSAEAEALFWWSQGMRLPPLVTTSPTNVPQTMAGVLGEDFVETPTTEILLGHERVNEDVQTGGRFTLGYWTNDAETFGILGNFFVLESDSFEFSATSEQFPVLARPFFNVQPDAGDPRQDAFLLGFPGVFTGEVHVVADSEVTGGEVYFSQNLFCGCGHRMDFLYGYRYLNVDESLLINDRVTFVDPAGIIPVGTVIDSFDLFDTDNTFNGGQLGLAWEYREGRWFWEAITKLALGSIDHEVIINGASTTITPQFVTSTSAGGLLAQPTNIGTYEESQFAVINESQLSIGYQLTPWMRATLGYNLIYLSHVMRPSEQIDLLVNPTQIDGGTLTGAARPRFEMRETDFWVQGINLGTEIRW